jgi:hypothetical protein
MKRKPVASTETSIDQALADRRLLGAGLDDLATWQTWRVALKAAFALPLTPTERKVFAAIAGDRGPPKKRVRELWCVVGRGGGKSRMAAALGDYLALFQKHKLSPGERGHVLVLAGSVDQARTVFGYSSGFLTESKVLEREVQATTASEIRLRNGVTLAVHPNSFRSIRGKTIMAAVFDEVAIWRDEVSATPDVEVYTAVLPSLARTGGMLIGISTPYRKTGLLYAKHRDHFGIDGDDILVVQGPALTFNSTLDVAAIAAARAADPAAAPAEWDAEFRADLATFLDDATVDRAINFDRPLELSPREGVIYIAFIDAAAGGADSYTLCIGHKEGDNFVIDVVRGTHGAFDPQVVTKQYAELCRAYGIRKVMGDNYAKDWVAGAWRDNGFEYVRSPKVKSDIYLEALPSFMRGVAHIPNLPRLVRELRLLERQTHRSGKDIVLKPKHEHDDFANVVCGVLWQLDHMARVAAQEPNIHVPINFDKSSFGPMPGSMGDSWSPPSSW